jgi:hypothetical protein
MTAAPVNMRKLVGDTVTETVASHIMDWHVNVTVRNTLDAVVHYTIWDEVMS